jgi:2,3-bisphosphoglycerate-dependent phosphoglycerate mutase
MIILLQKFCVKRVVLMRHGTSTANENNKFGGWIDVRLS